MTDGFITHWASVVEKHDESSLELKENYQFAKRMIDIPKVVFTKTIDDHKWSNTSLAKGDMVEEVNKLKKENMKDIIVYEGAEFVSSLVKENLIDEYHLLINPSAIGNGSTIFKNIRDKLNLRLIETVKFDCGIIHNYYQPVKE